MRVALFVGVAAACTFAGGTAAHAQQPFVVDDTAVTAPGVVHIEISSQADGLRAPARPALWQHTFETEIAVGLPARIEVGFALPVISLVSTSNDGRQAAHGPGDSTLAAKWRITADPDAASSWSATAFLEFPTGSSKRGLGSSLVDYGVAIVSQVRVGRGWSLQQMLGGVFAGNWQSGAVGITARGAVLTGGSSVIRAIGRGQAGGELTFAWSPNVSLANAALGAQIGGNVPIARRMTLDLGLGAGWWTGSPVWSAQVGLSADMSRR